MSKRGKKKQPRGPQPRQPRQASPEVMPAADTAFYRAATVITRPWEFVQIVLAGAGGTGSYMAQHIGRLMHSLYRMDKGVHLSIVDPDVVKEENEGRQLFCQAERGVPKAEALARRYGHAWGLNTSSYVGEFDESLILGRDLTVVVGCVDNAAARVKLNEVLSQNEAGEPPAFYWLDCGNVRNFGRALLGSAAEAEGLRGAFSQEESGTCSALPGPAMLYPDLLTPLPEETPEAEGVMSCAQRAAANLQSLNINAVIAAHAADFLTRLLVTHDLKKFESEVNLRTGDVRSKYCLPEEYARVARKPEGYFINGRAAASDHGLAGMPDAFADAATDPFVGFRL
jgi:PRTRC genetic system ThiF family protein